MSLGENIRKRRLALKMSQQELADAVGYQSRSTIAKIEKTKSALSEEKLQSIANALNVQVENLISGEFQKRVHNLVNLDKLEKPDDGFTDKENCVAVILAGGTIRVNKYGMPFQFVCVKEKPIIVYTMELYQRNPLVNEIVVVCLPGWEDFVSAYAEKYSITKFSGNVISGKSGVASAKNAVEWLSANHKASDIVVIQESTRPFVEQDTISNAVLFCKKMGNAVTFERLDSLTVFSENESENELSHMNSNRLIDIQSPEAYKLGSLRHAFSDAIKLNHDLVETDCAVFLFNMGRKLNLIENGHNNLRIVYEEDLKIMEALTI